MAELFESINPATGEPLTEYPVYPDSRIEKICDRAVAAQREWRRAGFAKRSDFLLKLAAALDERREELARLCTREMGKLLREARAEVDKCAWVCRYYAEHGEEFLADTALRDEAQYKSFIAWQPLGVVLAVMPWNFPYWQVFRCAVPALMAGNTVLLKHASNVTGCALAIEEVVRSAGHGDELLQVMVIEGERASDLIGDARIAAASLTGSEGAGRAVGGAAGAALKPSVLELGGSDPFIVLDLAHADGVIHNATQSRFLNCGQSCIAAKRFIVLQAVFDEFVERFAARAAALTPGDPLDEETTLAPMARADLRQSLHEQVEDAVRGGAQCRLGGEPVPGPGFFYPPTIITGIDPRHRLYCEEAFGPVASVFAVADEDEAVALANASPYGLGGSVWSADTSRALSVARRVQSGAVYVNRMMASDPRLPFGGIKRSGYGRELSRLGIREFVNAKTISVDMDFGRGT